MSIVRRLKRTLGGELAWKNLQLPPDERELLGMLRDPISDDSLREAMGVSVEVLVASMVRRGWVKWETPTPATPPPSPANPLQQPDRPPAETALERLRRKWSAAPSDGAPNPELPAPVTQSDPEPSMPSSLLEAVDVVLLIDAAPAAELPLPLPLDQVTPEEVVQETETLPPPPEATPSHSDIAEEEKPDVEPLTESTSETENPPESPSPVISRPAPTPDEIEKSIHAFLRMLSGDKEAAEVVEPRRKDSSKPSDKASRKPGGKDGRKDGHRDGRDDRKDGRKDR